MGNWQDIHEDLKIFKLISGDGGLGSVYKAEYDMFGKMVPVNIEVQQSELFPEEFIMRAAIRVDTFDPKEDSFVRQNYTAKAEEAGTTLNLESIQNIPYIDKHKTFDKEEYLEKRDEVAQQAIERIRLFCEDQQRKRDYNKSFVPFAFFCYTEAIKKVKVGQDGTYNI
ncbi:MAG TPA: hypothetical protein PLT73_06910 [Trichococcus flocculiformis]|nr:hypothetical protein [Trichococcus flocculiformis]